MQAVAVTTSRIEPKPAVTPLPVEVAAAAFYALQAVMGAVLWIGVGASDVVRSWMELVPERPQVTDGFMPADVIVIASSALAAWALWRACSWAVVPVMFTLGGIVYPTVYLIAWATTTDGSGDIALAAMLAAAALNCGSALLVWQARRPG